jgi:septum formation protein
MKLILASGSKNRRTALDLARIPYTSVPADIDEKSITDPDIHKRVVKVAKAKVEKVASSHQGLILGADGVNLCDSLVLEKPLDLKQAFDMIKLQSGKRCSFLTGYYLHNTSTLKTYQGTSECFYTFRHLSDTEITTYINSEPVLTWAAAFSPVNSSALAFIESVEGPFASFCFSMPFEKLTPLFKREGLI